MGVIQASTSCRSSNIVRQILSCSALDCWVQRASHLDGWYCRNFKPQRRDAFATGCDLMLSASGSLRISGVCDPSTLRTPKQDGVSFLLLINRYNNCATSVQEIATPQLTARPSQYNSPTRADCEGRVRAKYIMSSTIATSPVPRNLVRGLSSLLCGEPNASPAIGAVHPGTPQLEARTADAAQLAIHTPEH